MDALIAANGIILRWSSEARRLLGWTPDAVEGRCAELLFAAPTQWTEVQVRLRADGRLDFAGPWRRPDGHHVHYKARFTQSLGEGSVQPRTELSFCDEPQHPGPEDWLEAALKAAGIAAWRYELAADRLTSSAGLAALLGFAPGTALSLEPLRARLRGPDLQQLREALLRAFAKREPFALQLPMGGDGRTQALELRGTIAVNPSGLPCEILGVVMEPRPGALGPAGGPYGHRLVAALEAAAMAAIDYEVETERLCYSGCLNRLYGYPPDQALTVEDLRARYHPEDGAGVCPKIEALARDPAIDTFAVEFRLRMSGGEERWLEAHGAFERRANGRVVRTRAIIQDISERKSLERQNRLLMGELHHRIKNILAVVEAIAHQTYRTSTTLEGAREAHMGRLAALRRGQDLLLGRGGVERDLNAVIEVAVAPYRAQEGRWSLEGPVLAISDRQAMALILALHELATNAVKYGALSNSDGRIAIRWGLEDGEPAKFWLQWQESEGPKVQPPAHRGFGTRMVETSLSQEFAGTVVMAYPRDGLVCALKGRVDGPKAG